MKVITVRPSITVQLGDSVTVKLEKCGHAWKFSTYTVVNVDVFANEHLVEYIIMSKCFKLLLLFYTKGQIIL